ncbi:MAG: hypothetical protein IKU09_01275 [Firmicutes bacterium]|nr:hypothetical protein [Bacillota bacterium]
MKNRKGSFTVFVLMIFSSLIILVWAVITASAREAVSASADHFGRLWGTSILAEYDVNLKDRYGLYAYFGEQTMVEEKLNQYALYSFRDKSYIRYEGSSCSLNGYSLAEPDNLKRQMKQAVLAGNRSNVLKPPIQETEIPYGQRAVTSRWILDNLPSKGSREETDISSAAETIKNGSGLQKLTESAAVNQYIFTYFRHYCGEENLSDTFFKNEIEYILCGKADDEIARKKIRQKLILLRNMLNLTYLYSCPEKREAAMALAAVMTPGPEAVLTQGVLLELWAFAEAENDIAILYDNKSVALLKGDSNWAVSLENAVGQADFEGNAESETRRYIRPESMEGADYEDYLRILMNTVPERIRILRAMDLIQINMKYLYCDYFRIQDYYVGLRYNFIVNNKEHLFEETYEREEREE